MDSSIVSGCNVWHDVWVARSYEYEWVHCHDLQFVGVGVI